MLTIFLSDQEDFQMRHDPRGVDVWIDDLLQRENKPARKGVEEIVHTVVTTDVGDLRQRVIVSGESSKTE